MRVEALSAKPLAIKHPGKLGRKSLRTGKVKENSIKTKIIFSGGLFLCLSGHYIYFYFPHPIRKYQLMARSLFAVHGASAPQPAAVYL